MNRLLHEFFRTGFFIFALLAGFSATAQHLRFSTSSNTVKNCDSGQVTFNDITTPPTGDTIESEYWRFPHSYDSSTCPTCLSGSNQQGIIYPRPGKDTIYLTDSFSSGKVITLDSVITILPDAYAKFVPINGGACSDSSVSFINYTDTAMEGVKSYSWNFGDSTTSSLKNPPPHKYKYLGSHTASLVVTSLNGCVVTSAPQPAIVYDPPVIDSFTLVNTCSDSALHIHYVANLVYGFVDSVTFDFDTGYASANPPRTKDTLNLYQGRVLPVADTIFDQAEATFSHTYANPGTYTIHIHVQSTYGCSADSYQTVIMKPIPVNKFRVQTECRSAGDLFYDSSAVAAPSHIAFVYWTYGDGTTDTIFAPFAGKFPHRHLFVPQSDTITYFTVVGHAVTENGCIDSSTQIDTVYRIPINKFSFNSGGPGCANFSGQFIDQSTMAGPGNFPDDIVSYGWNFGDINSGPLNTDTGAQPTHNYKSPGNYVVTHYVYTGRGCMDSSQQTITIQPHAAAGVITPSTICAASTINNTVYFKDNSKAPAGYSITGYYWDFGDGSSTEFSTAQNPSHIYFTAGTFIVTHAVFTNAGCADTTTTSVTVLSSPVSQFSSSSQGVCFGQQSRFTDASTDTASPITSYYWNFGDAGTTDTSTAKNPTHQYANHGSFYVLHSVLANNGCSDTDSVSVTVYQPPVAKINPNKTSSQVCANSIATFNDTDVLGNTTDVRWNFGDGTNSGGFSTSPTVYHTYTTPGKYIVTDYVETATGCEDSATTTINVDSLPVPYMETWKTDVCAKSPALFFDSSYFRGGLLNSVSPYTTTWDFGDGTALYKGPAGATPTHVYTSSGTYTVTLYDTSLSGCGASYSQQVTILPGPVSSGNLTNDITWDVCVNATANFFNTSSIVAPYSIVGSEWFFGDGATSTATSPSHVYTTAGIDTVKLVSLSNAGCSDTFVHIITIDPLPKPFYTVSQNRCSGVSVTFSGEDTLKGDFVNAGEWFWNIAGTSLPSEQTQNYIFNTPGSNNVSLSVTNINGCSATFDSTISIYATPSANFVFDTVCLGQTTNFLDASILPNVGLGDTLNSWFWQFGDSTTDSIQNVSHTYQYAGNHGVELTVNTNHDCPASVTEQVLVRVTPVARIVYLPNPVTITNPHVTFYDSSINSIPGKNWWDLGDGYFRSDSTTVSHVYDTPGQYIVRLAVFNSDGCTDTLKDTINVEQIFTMFIPNCFSPNGDGVNDVWRPVSEGVLTYELQIINTWGGEMFRTTDPSAGWIGDYDGNGKIAPVGIYIYRIVCTDVYDQVIHVFKGNITIVK